MKIFKVLKPYLIFLLIIFVLTIPFTGILLYNYWKGFINDTSGYNSISVVIAYASGIINLVTVVFLYINYKEQKDQNDKGRKTSEENKRDIEFNRTIDLFYKQLEYSEKKMNTNPYLKNEIDRFFHRLNDTSTSLELEYVMLNEQDIRKYSLVLKYISEDLKVYNSILSRTTSSQIDRKFMIEITIENIYPNLFKRLTNFQKLYKDFKDSHLYKTAVEEQKKSKDSNVFLIVICNDIDYYLNIIRTSVYLETVEGLDLGE